MKLLFRLKKDEFSKKIKSLSISMNALSKVLFKNECYIRNIACRKSKYFDYTACYLISNALGCGINDIFYTASRKPRIDIGVSRGRYAPRRKKFSIIT